MNDENGTLCCFSTVERFLSAAPLTAHAIAKGCRPFLSGEEVKRRTEAITEDSKLLGLSWSVGQTTMGEQLLIPFYDIPGTDFGKTDACEKEPDESQKAHGIGLNWGGLLRFGRACEIGRRLFPNQWPLKFKSKLCNGREHLSFIEEIIWLGAWHDITAIEREVCPWQHIGGTKKIDWRFKSCGQTINLEIKYRARDWTRHADGPEFNIAKPGDFNNLKGKFPNRNEGELNVVGISSYAAPDRSWREETAAYLYTNVAVDAIVLWAPHFTSSDGHGPFEIQSQKKTLISHLLKVDREDSQHLVVVRHLWRERDERRAARVDEVIKALESYPEMAKKRILDR